MTRYAATPPTPVVLPTPADVGRRVAGTIARELEKANRRGSRFVLGCPSGRSPIPVLRYLAPEVAARGLDLRELHVVMMDEYVVPSTSGGLTAVDVGLPHSCRGFAEREIVLPLNEAADPGRPMSRDHVWLADPARPEAFDDEVRQLGGIDLFLLATGASDGHVAFNPPGSARDSRSRIVELAETTRLDNLETFPALAHLHNVPKHGVTVGIDTILTLSRRAVMVAHGPQKAHAVARIARAGGYEPDWPATVLVECRNPELVVDEAAATQLPPDRPMPDPHPRS